MTFVYHQREFLLLIVEAFLCGACMGVLYDAMRISRMMIFADDLCAVKLYQRNYPLIGSIAKKAEKKRIKEHLKRALLISQDILFMLIFTLVILMLLFFLNDGKFRIIVIFVAFFGLWCYLCSIGKLVLMSSEMIIFALRILVAYLLYFIMFPVRAICRAFKLVISSIYGSIYERYARMVIEKESLVFYNNILKDAESGFLINKDQKQNKDKKLKKGFSTYKRNGGINNAEGKAQKKI